MKRIEEAVKKHQELLEEGIKKEKELKERKAKQAEKKKRWEMLKWIVRFIDEKKPEWERRRREEIARKKEIERKEDLMIEERRREKSTVQVQAESPSKMKTWRLKQATEKARNWKEWRIRRDNELEEEEEERRQIERNLDEKERALEERKRKEDERMIEDMGWTDGQCLNCWKDPCGCLMVQLEDRLRRLSERGGEDEDPPEEPGPRNKRKRSVILDLQSRLVKEPLESERRLEDPSTDIETPSKKGRWTPDKTKLETELEIGKHATWIRPRPHHQPVAHLAGDGENGGPHHLPKEQGNDGGALPIKPERRGPHHHPVEPLDDGGERPIQKTPGKKKVVGQQHNPIPVA